MNNSQLGFRKNMSTALDIIGLVEEVTSIDEGKTTLVVFNDFKKMHSVRSTITLLVNKLEHCGIRGLAKDWVCSYLENRIRLCVC